MQHDIWLKMYTKHKNLYMYTHLHDVYHSQENTHRKKPKGRHKLYCTTKIEEFMKPYLCEREFKQHNTIKFMYNIF